MAKTQVENRLRDLLILALLVLIMLLLMIDKGRELRDLLRRQPSAVGRAGATQTRMPRAMEPGNRI